MRAMPHSLTGTQALGVGHAGPVGRTALGGVSVGDMPGSERSALKTFCRSVQGRASQLVESDYGASFDDRVRHTIELVEHDEAVVGLEILLDNLADFEINLSANERIELERLVQAFGLTAGTPRRYQVVYWHHDNLDEPAILDSEIGVDGYETRKVEEYRTGIRDVAGPGIQQGKTHLGAATVPPLPEINTDPQFTGRSLTAAEFEAVWTEAINGLSEQ